MPDDKGQGNQGAAGQGDAGSGQSSQTVKLDGSNWREFIPVELAKEKSLESIKDLGGLIKSHVEGQKMIGGSIRLPKADAKPEERDAVLNDIYGKLGRPESPDKYQITKPALPEDVPYNEEQQAAFLAVAHKAGLNSAQAQALINWHGEVLKASLATRDAEMEKSVETLKGKWGTNFDKNLTLANRALERIGGAEVKAVLDATGLGNHPALIEVFHKIALLMAEDGLIPGEVDGAVTQADAKAKLDAILADKKNPYWLADDPGHKDAVAKVGQLFQILHPGE